MTLLPIRKWKHSLTKCEWTLLWCICRRECFSNCCELLARKSLVSRTRLNYWALVLEIFFEHLSYGPRELSLFHFLGNWGSKISWLLGVKTTFKQKESNRETIKNICAWDFRNKKTIQVEKVNNWKEDISQMNL